MSTVFHRIISLVLVIALLFLLSCEVFADTLTLPSALEVIGEEAFYGDESLDEVVIPYGAASIGPRAFAYSGMKKITIPNTVTEIAEDAFERTEGLTILSPAGSYASEYADFHAIQWEYDDAYYVNEQLAERMALIDRFSELDSIVPEDMDFSLESTEGISDPDILEVIDSYNAYQLEMQSLHEEYLSTLDDLTASFDSMAECILGLGAEVDGSGASLEIEGIRYSVPQSITEVIGADYEIVSNTLLENGDVQIEIISGGSTYVLKGTADGLTLIDPSGTVLRMAFLRGDNAPPARNFWWDRIVSAATDLDNRVTTITSCVDVAVEHNEALLARAELEATTLKNFNVAMNDPETAIRVAKVMRDASRYRGILSTLKIASGLLSPISAALNISSIQKSMDDYMSLEKIKEHGHPTAGDRENAELLDTAIIMSGNLQQAQNLLICSVASSTLGLALDFADIVSSIALLVPGAQGAAIAGKAAIFTARTGLKIALGATDIVVQANANTLVRYVRIDHDFLHGSFSIFGTVTDFGTKVPLSGVKVILDNNQTTTTDEGGKYILPDVDAGSHKLVFSLSGFEDHSETVTVAGSSKTVNISLSRTTPVSGKVTDFETNAALAGVMVTLDGSSTAYTDSSGAYSFSDVQRGAHSLRFEKSGYDSATVHLAEGQYTWNQRLTRKTYTVTGVVKDQNTGAGIAGAAVTLDDSRTTTTNSSGQYSFSNVASGSHTLSATKADYINTCAIVSVSDHDEIKNIILTYEIIPKSEFDPVFWEWCVNQFDGTYDAESEQIVYDGQLSKKEVAAVTSLNCDCQGFTSLVGIRNFPNLQYLDCSNNQLAGLDLSGCSKLTELNCYNNQLATVNVSGCSALDELYCFDSQLSSINVSGCTSLKVLYFSSNNLTSLDVSGLSSLEELTCVGSPITSLDVSSCPILTSLNCNENQLTSLNISNCSRLTRLDCNRNKLATLDVSDCSALTTLYCYGNQLTSLDVSGSSALTTLHCQQNRLTSLNLSGCSALTDLFLWDNSLESLDVSGCSSLTGLGCDSFQLSSLNVSGCSSLTALSCSQNQLSILDLSSCSALTLLDCSGNQLTSLDVSDCFALTSLDCSGNQLTSLDVSDCTNLTAENLFCDESVEIIRNT